jgi:oligopeptide transport system substrate-binding protein
MVTADDFVASWRRALLPETVSGFGVSYLYYLERASEINSGKAAPETLGAHARDRFTLDIRLQTPAAFLPGLLWVFWFCPVPIRVIDEARKRGLEATWTHQGKIVVNGPYTLAEWRKNHSVLLRRNPQYYAASAVRLEEVLVLPTRDEQTILNLYKAGASHAMRGDLLTPLTLPALGRKRDLQRAAALRTVFYSVNSRRPPFDRLLFRYALNMALNKQAITVYLSGGQKPAFGFVPTMPAFPSLTSLPVTVDGRLYDVLKFDPEGSRDLLAKAGYRGGLDSDGNRLSFPLVSSQRPRSAKTAEILQRQWREHLGIEARLSNVTESIWGETLTNKQYEGMIEDAWPAGYLDPNDFLSAISAPGNTGATWTDPQFDARLLDANGTIDSASRLTKLAEAEAYLMRSMPLVPVYFDSYSYLQKPFVRGLGMNPGNMPLFKYAWIDTGWRPQ